MALFRTIGGGTPLTQALTLLNSNEQLPMGAVTIADGVNSYKYIYMARVQGSASDVTVRDETLMSIEDFVAAGSVTLGSTNTCTITYTDNNTITLSQSSSTQEAYVTLIK